MKKYLPYIFASVTFIMGCSNTSSEKAKEQTGIAIHEKDQHDEVSEKVELYNGQKWMVNEEMKPFILESETVLNEYIQAESNDYTTLAAHLKEKNSGLIKSCTMKGESHDELHKWLYPHIQLIESLAKAENVPDANAIIAQLKTSFKTYHNYFL